MKLNRKIVPALILVCLIMFAACRSLNNNGQKDWLTVEIRVDQPELAQGRNQSAASGAQTALITAIPATVSTITSHTDYSTYFDQQLQNLVTGTVTLSVPLNEPMQLVKRTYSSVLDLEQASLSDSYTAIGTSASFSITGSETSKTVTISYSEGSWTFVDGDGVSGINRVAAANGVDPRLVEYNSKLYAFWAEPHGTYAVQNILASEWDGSSTWTSINENPWDGLNYQPSDNGEHIRLAVFENKIWVTWVENYFNGVNDKRQVRVKAWDGTSWTWQDNGMDDGGINMSIYDSARMPFLAVHNNELFLAWGENTDSGNFRNVRVKKWDGTSSWVSVDGGGAAGAAGINKNVVDGDCESCAAHLITYNTKLYAVWGELYPTGTKKSQVRIAEWDGTSTWTFVDDSVDADPDSGLNKDITRTISGPVPAVLGSKLYILWSESNSLDKHQIRLIEWDGTTWAFVDGDALDIGLNKDSTYTTIVPELYTHDSKLYATWSEQNAASKYQIRVLEWDGVSAKTFIDGDGADGINKDTALDAVWGRPATFNSQLYLTWAEGVNFFVAGMNFNIRVIRAP